MGVTIGEYLSGGITAQIHYHRFIWKRSQVRRYQVTYTRVDGIENDQEGGR